jgi:hypothetical protein
MNVRLSFCGMLLLMTIRLDARDGDRLSMRISPAVAIAPADLVVRTTIEVDEGNRAIQVIAESENFYRSSEMPLEGERAPRVTQFRFRSVPSGEYVVHAILKGSQERELASVRQQVNVAGNAAVQ